MLSPSTLRATLLARQEWWRVAASRAAAHRCNGDRAVVRLRRNQGPLGRTHPARSLASTAALRDEHGELRGGDGNGYKPRVNMCNIEMMPGFLWHHLFGGLPIASAYLADVESESKREHVQAQLTAHGLWGKEPELRPQLPAFTPPPLQGTGGVLSHFDAIARRCSQQSFAAAVELSKRPIPPMPGPDKWVLQPGWTRYSRDGTAEPVDNVFEEGISSQSGSSGLKGKGGGNAVSRMRGMVLDVETAVIEGNGPVIAVAATQEAWYVWLSQSIFSTKAPDASGKEGHPMELFSLIGSAGRKHPGWLIAGHNISFDRARCREEYTLSASNHEWIDTMSLHMAVHGLSNQQLHKASDDNPDEHFARVLPKSLVDCCEHWGITPPEKQIRDIFVEGTMQDIRDSLQECIAYCAKDVLATHQLYQKVFTEFLSDHYHHRASFVGMLEMTKAYLPTSTDWKQYLVNAEREFEAIQTKTNQVLLDLVHNIIDTPEEEWCADPWLKHLDWTTTPVKYTKAGVPYKNQRLPGKPNWYKALWKGSTATGGLEVTPKKVIAPYLYRMKYRSEIDPDNAYPLFHHTDHKWGYLVPKGPQAEPHIQRGLGPHAWSSLNDKQMENTHLFFKLPTAKGDEANCGSPLAKEYLAKIENGSLLSDLNEVKEALEGLISCSYWMSARARITGQYVVWEEDSQMEGFSSFDSHKSWESESNRGAILPMIAPMGTITRRARESTFLTASNPKRTRIGSELKAMVQAPPGTKFVGADVDSQELWIASLLGDHKFEQVHGATAISWMTLRGAKKDGTDMHSKTAEIVGCTRDQAKIFNYGRIYGAGQKFAATLVQQFSGCSRIEAESLAKQLYKKTKGEQTALGYAGGTESHMFNMLEEIASQPTPCTPVLQFRMPKPLQPLYLAMRTLKNGADQQGDKKWLSQLSEFEKGNLMNDLPAKASPPSNRHKNKFDKNARRYLPTRTNWVVQSSAVDYLHLMLLSMRHLISTYDMDARLCITIHDELRYIVADEDVNRFAFALHLTNMYTRAAFSASLGMFDLPHSVAFFSAVDVDTVLRKEVDQNCMTPSFDGSGIPNGTTLDIYQAGEACGWSLEKARS